VHPRTGVVDMEVRTFFTLPRLQYNSVIVMNGLVWHFVNVSFVL
jgi:hypothetical protein